MDKNVKSGYKKYLASMHGKLNTPDDVIRKVVKEGVGDLVSKKRIIAGEVSEVYNITLENKKHVVLRISRSSRPSFLQEKWATEQVKKLGVPVPEILLIKYLTVGDQELSFCLMEKAEGKSLERGGINFESLPEATRKSYILQAGEILSKIHSIETLGFGWIIGEGKAEHNTADEVIDDLLKRKERIYEVADAQKFDRRLVDKALDIVDRFRERYSHLNPRLNHSDYGHKHFMVKKGKIVAVLDWGGVRSDSPIYDFANWDYWYGHYIPTNWLKEGYQNKQLFDENFEDTLHVMRIMKGVEVADWYESQNYREAVEKALAKLTDDLNYFK